MNQELSNTPVVEPHPNGVHKIGGPCPECERGDVHMKGCMRGESQARRVARNQVIDQVLEGIRSSAVELHDRLEKALKRLGMANSFALPAVKFEEWSQETMITIERRNAVKNQWAIGFGLLPSFVLGRDGKLYCEPKPSSRSDEFYARCRWTLDEAFERVQSFYEGEGAPKQATEAEFNEVYQE